jgi:hypothetical protein
MGFETPENNHEAHSTKMGIMSYLEAPARAEPEAPEWNSLTIGLLLTFSRQLDCVGLLAQQDQAKRKEKKNICM